jgi:hypothetical protein
MSAHSARSFGKRRISEASPRAATDCARQRVVVCEALRTPTARLGGPARKGQRLRATTPRELSPGRPDPLKDGLSRYVADIADGALDAVGTDLTNVGRSS